MVSIPRCSSKRLIKALLRVGFEISTKGGRGSHTKVIDPKSGHSTAIPDSRDLSYTRDAVVKWAVRLGYSRKEILDNL